MSNANNMAFPVVTVDIRTPNDTDQLGLTKRELFAAMAMQGILANSHYEPPRRKKLGLMAEDAVSAADALLIELAKEPQS